MKSQNLYKIYINIFLKKQVTISGTITSQSKLNFRCKTLGHTLQPRTITRGRRWKGVRTRDTKERVVIVIQVATRNSSMCMYGDGELA